MAVYNLSERGIDSDRGARMGFKALRGPGKRGNKGLIRVTQAHTDFMAFKTQNGGGGGYNGFEIFS